MLTITVAQDGSGDFASIAEAVLAVPYEEEALVQVGPGLYREKLICEKRCITLRGAGADRTRLVWGDGGKLPHKDGRPTHTFRSYTAFFSGGSITVEDLTIANDAGPGSAVGQAIAAYVMALALTVGGARTTILLATQPAGLTVAPAAVEWEAPAISLQPEKSASTEAASERTAAQAPASSAAVPVTPTEAEVPASSTEPAAEAPVEEAPAAVPDETPAEPSAETPAADPMAGPAEENDHENALFPHFVQETAELAAEDPLSAPEETLEAEAAETPAASENGEAVASAGISDTNGTILLTPEEIRAALDAGTLDASNIDTACLTDENGLLSWLWNLLFGIRDD